MTPEMEEAIEIACGDTISHEGFQPTTASKAAKQRATGIIRRFLAELDEGLTVHELLEQLGPGRGRFTRGDDDEE